MYRPFRVVVPHWRLSSDGKPDSEGGSYFEDSPFVSCLKQKLPCHGCPDHNKKCNVITTYVCTFDIVRVASLTSGDRVRELWFTRGEAKEFNTKRPKAVSRGLKPTARNSDLFRIPCGTQRVRKAEAFKSGL